nr:hypothetical protein [Bacteroidia bacterium]
ASGKTAELKFPIDPSQSPSAQSTIPLWYMNETTGIWKEEGEAVKTGNFFVGNVSHFSTWNCDFSGERTDIQGTVVDCNNNPVGGIVITIDGFMNVITNNSGNFATWVPAGYIIDIQVLKINNPVLSNDSQIQTITAIGGILNVIPAISIDCASRIAGVIYECTSGSLSSGTLLVTWNGGSIAYYTSSGNYVVIAPENTTLNLTAFYNGLNGNATLTSGAINDTVNVPDILLCNATGPVTNKFTITDIFGVVTPYTLNITTDASLFYDNNSDGAIDSSSINLFGTTNPGNYNFTIQSHVYTEIGGIYPFNTNMNGITITLMKNGTLYYYSNTNSQQVPTTTLNGLVFTDYGVLGAPATGIFEFNTFSAGTVTDGEFSIIRNN